MPPGVRSRVGLSILENLFTASGARSGSSQINTQKVNVVSAVKRDVFPRLELHVPDDESCEDAGSAHSIFFKPEHRVHATAENVDVMEALPDAGNQSKAYPFCVGCVSGQFCVQCAVFPCGSYHD
jgi:hypothetical protein